MASDHSKESVQGVQTQESDKAGNTIVTRDEAQEVTILPQPPLFGRFVSSEPSLSFDDLLNRWIPLDAINISVTQPLNTVVAQYRLPEMLYRYYREGVVLTPFTVTLYGELEFEFKFVVNANRFHCGRVVASYRNDPYGYEAPHESAASALSRPHVLIDLALNVEGRLRVPFDYHRALLRLTQRNDTCHVARTGYCSLVTLSILSPLRVGDGAPNNMDIRPMVRVVKGTFYGMSYRVDVQMDTVKKIVDVAAPAPVRSLIRGIEIIHDTVRDNFDKPSDYTSTTIVPQPSAGFSWGKGPTLSYPMRLGPSAMTPCISETRNDPKTALDVARTWGLICSYPWQAAHHTGDMIGDLIVDPTVRIPTAQYTGTPTPLEYMCSIYNFWSGPIDVRLDFISNSFHTGAVMICAEFGRQSDNTITWKAAQNTYTKVFHLGEQKSVEFTIPYIYDTVLRRSNAPPFDANVEDKTNLQHDNRVTTWHSKVEVSARLRVYVVNELRPPNTASQVIEVLVFWRAGENFRLHGLKQSSFIPARLFKPKNFPSAETPKSDAQNVGFISAALNWLEGPVRPGVRDELRKRDAGKHTPEPVVEDTSKVVVDLTTGAQVTEAPPAAGERREASTSAIDQAVDTTSQVQVDRHLLIEGRLPAMFDRYVRVRDGPGRVGCEYYISQGSQTRALLRTDSDKEKYPRLAYYEVFTVLDPMDAARDEHRGWVRYADYKVRTEPEVQMNSDSSDQTANFGLGLPTLQTITTEDQTSFKDILRRPVLILKTVKVPAGYSYAIPLTVPDIMNNNAGSPHPLGIPATPQAIIISMFRFWRGSIRLTVIVNDSVGMPVYLTHVPFSGVVIDALTGELGPNPIYGSGLSTQFIVPSVNPVLTVEAPYDTINNWSYTNTAAVNTRMCPRDIVDFVSGHMVISNPANVDRFITVWWSAGDDFELANYYGVPRVTQFVHMRSWKESCLSDQTPETQMDSMRKLKGAIKTMPDLTKQASETMQQASETLGGIQVVTEEASTKLATIAEQAEQTLSTAQNTLGEYEKLAKNMDSRTEKISIDTSQMLKSVQTQLEGIIASVGTTMECGKTCVVLLRDLILDITVAMVDKSWFALGAGVVRALTTIVGASQESIMGFAQQLGDWFSVTMKGEAQTQGGSTQAASLTGILMGILGVAFGCKFPATKDYESGFMPIIRSLTTASGIGYINGMVRLIEKMFESVQGLAKDALAYVDPGARALRKLCANDKEIDNFVKEAQRYTMEVNSTMLSQPRYRQKMWALVIQAQSYQRAIMQSPANDATRGLSQACKMVIDYANEHHIDLTCSPYRFEPWVFSLFGEPGIGKSFIMGDLIPELLNSVGYKIQGADMIYTRAPGMSFWDGYRNQPVILYDDFGNMTQVQYLSEQYKELYQLKTPAEFIANMASLNDKGIRGTPLIVAMNTNDDFPTNVSQICSKAEAVYRRRDQLIKVALQEGWTPKQVRAADPDSLKLFPHLKFSFHNDPAHKDRGYSRTWYNYADFVVELKKRFKDYHTKKMKILKNQMRTHINQVLEDYEPGEMIDPYLAFFTAQGLMDMDGHTGELPSSKIESAVRQTMELLQKLRDHDILVEDSGPQTQGIGSWTLGLSAAMLTSDVVLTKIAEGLRHIVSWILDRRTEWHPKRQCSACHLERQCVVKCTQMEHYYCMECAPYAKNKCHQCHVDLIGVVTEKGKGIIETILQFVARMASKASNTALDIASFWGADALQIYVAMTRVTTFLTLLQHDAMSGVAYALGRCVTVNFMSGKGDPGYVPPERQERAPFVPNPISRQTVPKCSGIEYERREEPLIREALQGDDAPVAGPSRVEEPETQIGRVELEKIPIYRIDIHDDELENFCRTQTEVKGPCMHSYLLDNIDFVRFFQGKYVVEGTHVPIHVNEKPCHHQACPFHDVETVKMFLDDFVRVHEISYRSTLSEYYHDKITLDHVKLLIPEILLPRWIKERIPPPRLGKWEWWKAARAFCKKFKHLFAMTGAGIVLLGGLVALWKWLPQKEVATQSNIYSAATAEHLRKTHRTINVVRGKTARTQGGTMFEEVERKVVRNMVLIRVVNDQDEGRYLLAQGLVGHWAILPKHYYKAIKYHVKNGHHITIEPVWSKSSNANHLRTSYAFDPKDFIEHPDTDLALFRMPNSYPLFKDIRSCFCKDSDLNDRPLQAEAEIIVGPNDIQSFVRVTETEILGFRPALDVRDEDGSMITNRDVLEYDFSRKGACGSMVLAVNSNRPILAMHTAGMASGLGFGTLITQEMLDDFVPKDIAIVQSEDVHLLPLSEKSFIIDDFDVALEYLGEVPVDMKPHVPSKSKIRKSCIHGVGDLQPCTEPAILHKDDERYQYPRSPLYYGVAKHGKRTLDMPRSQVMRAMNALYDRWFRGMRPIISCPRKLTMEQAVLGFPGIPYYDPMKLNTSAGYPWSKKRTDTRKTAWITVHEFENKRTVEIDAELVEEIKRKEELRKRGVVPATIFVDTLKDERRPPAKVQKQGGTRVFCSSPIDFTIATRQNLLHFCAAMMKARFKVYSAVGINPKGREWTDLFYHLTSKGGNRVFQLDYSNFGPGFNAVIAEAAAEIIVMWTKDYVLGIDEVEIRSLLQECIQSAHIAGGTVYRQFCGSPSGAAITTIINTLVNLLFVLVTWEALLSEKYPQVVDPWREFEENVFVAAYGDDLIGAVSSKYQDMFNGRTINQYLGTFGVTTTNTSMEKGDIIDFVPIWESEFLKRSFIKHPTRDQLVLAPLRWDSVNDATQWIWSGPNARDATIVNCEAALMEAHGHGPTVFNDFKRRVNQSLRRKKITGVTLDWEKLDSIWFETGLPDTIYGFNTYNFDDNIGSINM